MQWGGVERSRFKPQLCRSLVSHCERLRVSVPMCKIGKILDYEEKSLTTHTSNTQAINRHFLNLSLFLVSFFFIGHFCPPLCSQENKVEGCNCPTWPQVRSLVLAGALLGSSDAGQMNTRVHNVGEMHVRLARDSCGFCNWDKHTPFMLTYRSCLQFTKGCF